MLSFRRHRPAHHLTAEKSSEAAYQLDVTDYFFLVVQQGLLGVFGDRERDALHSLVPGGDAHRCLRLVSKKTKRREVETC